MSMDWGNLNFGFIPTNANFRSSWKDGEWSALEKCTSEKMDIHIAATVLHYGQSVFEGMKAYRGIDGKLRIFRWDENSKRLRRSAQGILMPEFPDVLFIESIRKLLKTNKEFIPPFGNGATFYIRPYLFGTGARIGVHAADEYLYCVLGTPVGPYYKTGFNPATIAIIRDTDRAAPLGTGQWKVGGNYAASLRGLKRVHDMGYSSGLYLDSREKKYVDEIGTANFFGIKDGKYITPESCSILPSITNMSLIELAKDMGYEIERRPVPVEELDSFEEVGACGTAAIITPIGSITDIENNRTITYCESDKAGPVCTELFNTLQEIQFGQVEDKHGWITIIDED